MQSETGFPSSHQLKSYVASKSRLKLAARAVLSADAGLLVLISCTIYHCTLQPHHTTTVLRPFFRDHPGERVSEENFWTLWCTGRLTEANTPTIRLGATASGLTSAHLHHPPLFYRPDALPAAQPTVTKH